MLKLTFFGKFSIKAETAVLIEDSRSPKIWRALAYLLANRNKRISLRDFSRFLHGNQVSASYPSGGDSLVKTTLHRIRTLLAPLKEEENALTLICRDGGVFFDPALSFSADTDRFDEIARRLQELSSEGKKETEERALSLYRTLFALYQGQYLPEIEDDSRILFERSRYHSLYTSLCEGYFALLLERNEIEELLEKTSRAIDIDPYYDGFHYFRIRALAAKGETALALALYDNMEKLFFKCFRINPSERLRRLKSALSFPPEETTAKDALAFYLAHDEPLSRESFAVLIGFLNQTGTKNLSFALITLKNADDGDKALSHLRRLSLAERALCRHTPLSFALLTDKDETQLSVALAEMKAEGVEFSLQILPFSSRQT